MTQGSFLVKKAFVVSNLVARVFIIDPNFNYRVN